MDDLAVMAYWVVTVPAMMAALAFWMLTRVV
jgi:hypothetical protein